MKINFNASFKEVARLVKAQATPASEQAGEAAFTKLLSRIAPDQAQRPEVIDDIKAQPRFTPEAEVADRGPMASFRFEPPPLQAGQIGPISPEMVAQEAVNTTDPGVKSPSILSVRRITDQIERPFADLRKTERVEEVAKLVDQAGVEHGVDPSLGLAVVRAESSFNANAVSSDGHASKGLFQLLDSTGQEIHQTAQLQTTYDPFNPEQNVELGVRHIRKLLDLFSSENKLINDRMTIPAANISSLEKLAVAAFNAGEGRVASAQQRTMTAGGDPTQYEHVEPYLPESTQEYVSRVMGYRDEFEVDRFG